jgi:hypothetical protein
MRKKIKYLEKRKADLIQFLEESESIVDMDFIQKDILMSDTRYDIASIEDEIDKLKMHRRFDLAVAGILIGLSLIIIYITLKIYLK